MKNFLLLLVTTSALLAIVTRTYAGGWAIVTLQDFPEYAVEGKVIKLTFFVRQHGVTLLNGLKPVVRASTKAGLKTSGSITRGASTGEYTAVLTFPQSGDWTITVNNGFDSNPVTLPLLRVISPTGSAPPPFADGTRGGRLFVTKGCMGCHRHQEINPDRTSEVALDLSGKRFPEDYLKRFLADPSIKPAEMPNLKLTDAEITALSAFINKTTKKTR